MIFDAIVLGCGGVGSAALFHLARRGWRVLGLDRFPAGHDRGSSHGQTRIIRQAYFEHPDYVPLLLRAYQLWEDLERQAGRTLFRETGLLQVGPANGTVVSGVLASARQHQLTVAQLSAAEVQKRFPGFECDESLCGVFEPRAGLLLVEECVRAHIDAAISHGALFRSDVTVQSWQADGQGVTIRSDGGTFQAGRLVIAAGPWAGQLLADLALPLTVRRKTQFWFQTNRPEYQADGGCPAFLFEISAGMFYGLPQIDSRGLKLAEHTGGAIVSDPLTIDRSLDMAELGRVQDFAAAHLPRLDRRLSSHAVCMYTLTPDEHFIVGRHPRHQQVVFAAGLSGHGFKFTGVLGEALADLISLGQTSLPIDFLNARRWAAP